MARAGDRGAAHNPFGLSTFLESAVINDDQGLERLIKLTHKPNVLLAANKEELTIAFTIPAAGRHSHSVRLRSVKIDYGWAKKTN